MYGFGMGMIVACLQKWGIVLVFIFYLFIYFIFTHNQLEINQSACRNKDCE